MLQQRTLACSPLLRSSLAKTTYNCHLRLFTMSAKKQEPKILNTTDFQPDGFKWTRLKKIDWEDETGRKVSKMSMPQATRLGGKLTFRHLVTESMGSG
jgi:hypothetical protein